MSTVKRHQDAVAVLFFCFLIGIRLFFWISPAHDAVITPVYLWPVLVAMVALLYAAYRPTVPTFAAISLLLSLWFLAVTLINGDRYLEYNLRFIVGIFSTFGFAFPLLFFVEEREKWLARVAVAFASCVTVLALLALYSWITGSAIVSPFSGDAISIHDSRLYFFFLHPNEIACAFGLGFFCWLLTAFRSKSLARKIACVVLSVPAYLAAIPCVSRTSAVAISLALAMAVLLCLLTHLRIPRASLRIAVSAVLAAVIAVFSCNVLIGRVFDLQQLYRERADAFSAQASVLDAAEAETAASADTPVGGNIAVRDFSMQLGNLQGRTDIWKEALLELKKRPVTLLVGNTDGYVARISSRVEGLGALHMQNIWIEMLMQTGIVGLALYAAIMLSALFVAIKTFLRKDAESWKRYLCVGVPLVMVTGMMEIYPGVSGNITDMMGMLLVGAVLALFSVKGKKEASREA